MNEMWMIVARDGHLVEGTNAPFEKRTWNIWHRQADPMGSLKEFCRSAKRDGYRAVRIRYEIVDGDKTEKGER